ncbi:unnamed protein product [Polarella glacialis]|uniref:J domain-containing protein n=1 Tax=Polarella glacialis TaxID=89957 RepID=A0A813D4U2_POLGL|nr:unnamed protein product [Polarella glacialis]
MADGGLDGENVDFVNEKDLYKILDVPKGAKSDDIKKAYRKRSLRYHPDKNAGDPDAKLKFQRISEAYSILSDAKKRLKYDKSGDMDLEDFDMDQFMNMWVGEMMEEGGMVDDMMKEVMPWTSEEDKMAQFMDEKVQANGGKEWATETMKSMKASFESFMKQIAGIGDGSGEFVLPDGTKALLSSRGWARADMSKVKGVPDIRSHMQTRVS